MENEMITVREIAKYLRVSLPSAYKLVNAGTIPHVIVGNRYIIPRDAFFFWVENNTFGGMRHE
ncbi:MAG: helix-turn-helix domain-containing protein [Lachnospiraceae bacterium]|nr:helix-turn-helix domain-containing protein [Lachnospiraceae bacterium]